MHNGVKAHALDQHNAARLWAWSKAAVAAVTWEAYTMKIDFDGKVALVTGVGAASADLSPQRQRSDRRDLVADRQSRLACRNGQLRCIQVRAERAMPQPGPRVCEALNDRQRNRAGSRH